MSPLCSKRGAGEGGRVEWWILGEMLCGIDLEWKNRERKGEGVEDSIPVLFYWED